MRTYASQSVPGRKTMELGRIDAQETARRGLAAERVAVRELEKKAADKGADAIVCFKLHTQLVFAGNECTVSGVAVKFID